jgi:hypothetical protein
MKRLLNIALLIAFQICYLEWPPHNSMFLFYGEYELFSKKEHLLENLIHPVILSGLFAQIILLFGAILPNLNKKINAIGVVLLGAVVLLFFIVGLLSLNYKIVLSTIPYLSLAVFYFIRKD